MRLFNLALIFGLLAGAATAQDETRFTIGGDTFAAGRTVVSDATGGDDLFAAGQSVRANSDLTGSVYAAGQDVSVTGSVGGDVHVMGQTVTVTGDVLGDVSVAGQDLRIDGALGGDLRAAGSVVEIAGPVAGYAILGGETVRIDGEVAGDVMLGAERAMFGPGARIGGTLTLFEDDIGDLVVPESVISEDRITRRELEDWEAQRMPQVVPSVGDLVGRFLGGVVMVALLAALIAALIPERLAEMRRTVLAAPFRTLGVGFVTQSAIVGSVFVVGMTLIGLVLVPGILLLAGASALAGYVVGAYAFGVGLLLLIGREEPDTLAERAIAAGAGALVAGLLALVPFLGWLFVFVLSLAGIGAIMAVIIGWRRGASA
jgi:cytoskeletal protein CcmA (bactofilin family)